MKPEDVPDDLMSKGRGAFVECLSRADLRRITPLSEQVNAILAAVLPAHERQVRERVAAEARFAASQVGRHPDFDWDVRTLLWFAEHLEARGES